MTKLVASQPVMGNIGWLDPGWARDDKLQAALDAVLAAKPALRTHKFAVVDLTNDPANPDPQTRGFKLSKPAYAGTKNHDEQVWIASLAKLLPLYCAFRLRADLTALSIPNLATAAAAIRRNCDRMAGFNRTLPMIPKLEQMFAPPSASGKFDFTKDTVTDKQLEPFNHSNQSLDLNFSTRKAREHLRLMSGWSDDISASNVIRGLGFEYLWMRTIEDGLFRKRGWDPLTRHDSRRSGPAGLFLARDFAGLRSNSRPSEVPSSFFGSNQAGTARSIALLLTLLTQDALVHDQAGNVGMREMLRMAPNFEAATDRGEVSPIGIGMATSAGPGWAANQAAWDEDTMGEPPMPTNLKKEIAASKVGESVAADTEGNVHRVISNGLIVRTTRPRPGGSITITAVLVGIDNTQKNPVNLNDFGRLMAEKLDLRHPVAHP